MSFLRVEKPAIAMLQLPPLPGTHRYKGEGPATIAEQALEEAHILVAAGFDGLMLQNNGDHPSSAQVGPETVACMTAVACALRREFPRTGLSVLCNWDGVAAVAIAHAAGADFIRVERAYTGAELTAWGLMDACCHQVTRFRRQMGAEAVAITADVYEPHAVPLARLPLGDACQEAVEMGAQALWLCGRTFDQSLAMVAEARPRVGVPILLGGGARHDNVAQALRHFDGLAVARALKHGDIFARSDPALARSFMDAVRKARGW